MHKINRMLDKFTLSLSGGGALGIAHLGVLSDLEKADMTPSEIIGTSMGSIIGACLAIGMKQSEIFQQIEAIGSISNWVKFGKSNNSILSSQKVSDIFDKIFDDKTMSQTKIPLKVITTNLLDGNKRLFSSKDKDILIRDVLLASMAIPGLFSAQVIQGETYGDGYMCENLGLCDAQYQDILAVDVLGRNSFSHHMPTKALDIQNAMSMLGKSMRLLIYNQTKTNISHSLKKIYLIEPITKDYRTYQFSKAREIRELGFGLLEHITVE